MQNEADQNAAKASDTSAGWGERRMSGAKRPSSLDASLLDDGTPERPMRVGSIAIGDADAPRAAN